LRRGPGDRGRQGSRSDRRVRLRSGSPSSAHSGAAAA